MSLKTEIVADLITIETDVGSPTFTWNSGSYVFIPSIAEFSRELEMGGFSTNSLITATVRKLTAAGANVFVTYPSPQQKIVYSVDGKTYRIESIRHDPTGAFFRLIAVCENRGI